MKSYLNEEEEAWNKRESRRGYFKGGKMGCTKVEGLLLNLDHVHFVFRFYCLLLDLIKGRITSVLREAY